MDRQSNSGINAAPRGPEGSAQAKEPPLIDQVGGALISLVNPTPCGEGAARKKL
jgi:hypothetical protein